MLLCHYGACAGSVINTNNTHATSRSIPAHLFATGFSDFVAAAALVRFIVASLPNAQSRCSWLQAMRFRAPFTKMKWLWIISTKGALL